MFYFFIAWLALSPIAALAIARVIPPSEDDDALEIRR